MSTKPAILAIDQGTTSSRAIVFDDAGAPLAIEQKELPQHFPRDGWVEHDPDDIWRDTLEVSAAAIAVARDKGYAVAGIGITNQRETTIVWDRKTGRPIHKAIVWQDRRTADTCRALHDQGHEDLVRTRTGLLLDPYFSASKIAWILDHVDGARDRAEGGELAFGTVDSWLLWHLTGGTHATDVTNASRTSLFNIHNGDWDDDLLALFRVPRALLPDVRANCADFGTTNLFGDAIPIGGMAGDQQAATFGQACFAPGMIKSTYGTGCFALLNTGDQAVTSDNRLLTTIAWQIEDKVTYALEGSIFTAGAAVQWLRDEMGFIASSPESEAIAASLDHNHGVYLVPAFTGLGAPWWDPDARGTLTGLTRDTGKAHFVRAALEAAAFQTVDLLDAMAGDTGTAPTELRVDGGMAENNWLMQFLADVTNTRIVRPQTTETTALGAAYLAGLHCGLWPSLEAIAESWAVDRTYAPTMPDDDRIILLQGWHRAVHRTLYEAPE